MAPVSCKAGCVSRSHDAGNGTVTRANGGPIGGLCTTEQWQSSQFFNEVLRKIGADHELASLAVLPDGKRFSCIGLGRQMGDPPFGPRERQAIHLFHTELVELWRTPEPSHAGINGNHAALSPRLQQTLELLQRGLSEKQVAMQLRLSRHTVHDYVKELHRRFDAGTTTELVARTQQSRPFRPCLSLNGHDNGA